MSNKKSNYPMAQMNRSIEKVDGFISDTVSCISELAKFGKPQNEEELKERIHKYFDFCANSDFRPGIESLSLALGVDRTTFWRWCNMDIRVSQEWSDTCKIARQSIVAFTEAAANSGHLSPPIAIFALKNIANYKDAISFEDVTPMSEDKRKKYDYDSISAYRLPILQDELPIFQDDPENNDSSMM